MKLLFLSLLFSFLALGCKPRSTYVSPITKIEKDEIISKGLENPWRLKNPRGERDFELVKKVIEARDDFYFVSGEFLDFVGAVDSNDGNISYLFFRLDHTRDGQTVKDVTIIYILDKKADRLIYRVRG